MKITQLLTLTLQHHENARILNDKHLGESVIYTRSSHTHLIFIDGKEIRHQYTETDFIINDFFTESEDNFGWVEYPRIESEQEFIESLLPENDGKFYHV